MLRVIFSLAPGCFGTFSWREVVLAIFCILPQYGFTTIRKTRQTPDSTPPTTCGPAPRLCLSRSPGTIAVGDDVMTVRYDEKGHRAEDLVKLTRRWE